MEYYIIILFFLLNLLLFYYKNKINNKNYLLKNEILNNKLNQIIENEKKITLDSYHIIFKYIKCIFIYLKPNSITLHLYHNNENFEITLINFLFQIKTNIDKTNINIIGKYDLNEKIISNYLKNDITLKNIEDLNKNIKDSKDSNINAVPNSNINTIYLINICQQNNKLIGFLSLSYKQKNKLLKEKELIKLNKEIKSLSEIFIK
jgi:hypothetical protein